MPAERRAVLAAAAAVTDTPVARRRHFTSPPCSCDVTANNGWDGGREGRTDRGQNPRGVVGRVGAGEERKKKILLDACVERSTRLSDSCLVSRCVTLSKAACQFPNTLSLAAYQEAGERGVS